MADAYFRCFPSDFLNGVLGMEPDEIAVYTVVLMLIYDRGAPIPEDAQSLAWRCRMNTRRFNNVVEKLISLGKISRTASGDLTNERAGRELISRREASEKQARNAHARWSLLDKKTNENNVSDIATAMPPQCLPEPEPDNNRNLTVSCPKRVRTKGGYSEDFESLWKAYPTDPLMSKKEAFAYWQKLSPEDKQAASDSIPAFRAYCASRPDYRPVHASRYLSQRRFEGFVASARLFASQVRVFRDTPQGNAWAADYRRRGMSIPWDNKQSWLVPSEYPPGERAA